MTYKKCWTFTRPILKFMTGILYKYYFSIWASFYFQSIYIFRTYPLFVSYENLIERAINYHGKCNESWIGCFFFVKSYKKILNRKHQKRRICLWVQINKKTNEHFQIEKKYRITCMKKVPYRIRMKKTTHIIFT